MFGIFFLIDGHFLFTLELEIMDGYQRVCHPKVWARHFVGKIFVFIDALKYSAIPFCILIVLSILIIERVFHAEGISAQLQNRRPSQQYRQYTNTPNNNSRRNSSAIPLPSQPLPMLASNTRVGRRVTLMLLSVSIAFCVFSAPMSLMQIVESIVRADYHENSLAIGKALAELCQYINHSCNFFLYALTGRIFRREFVRLFFPTRLGSRQSTSAGVGMNGLGLGVNGTFLPRASHLSSRQGSLYATDVNRCQTYRHTENQRRSSPVLPNLYQTRQFNEQQSRRMLTGKSNLSIINPSPILNNRYSRSTNSSSNSIFRFWNLFDRNRKRRTSETYSRSSSKTIKTTPILPIDS